MADPRSSQWSTAADRKYNTMPNASSPVLIPVQAARSADLVSICFGDEEKWNASRLPAWAAWADLAHAQVPHVIIHTNQWLGQFGFQDYVEYLAAVDVDMLCIDNYNFPGGMPAGAEPRNTSTVRLSCPSCPSLLPSLTDHQSIYHQSIYHQSIYHQSIYHQSIYHQTIF
jgi:hypothetical protein